MKAKLEIISAKSEEHHLEIVCIRWNNSLLIFEGLSLGDPVLDLSQKAHAKICGCFYPKWLTLKASHLEALGQTNNFIFAENDDPLQRKTPPFFEWIATLDELERQVKAR